MRWLACVATVILVASGGCDKKQDAGDAGSGAATGVSAAGSGTASGTASGSAAGTATGERGDAGIGAVATVAMPERPVPQPQTMVGSGMSVEVQQKAIGYMVAMRAPHPDDVAADPAYASALVAQLKPIALSMDSGADKVRLNRVEMVANGRQIDILMASGCDEHTPQRAVVNRAGVQLSTLVSHGVLVVRCNDARIQCLQSTRAPDDVLCTTAPRHK